MNTRIVWSIRTIVYRLGRRYMLRHKVLSSYYVLGVKQEAGSKTQSERVFSFRLEIQYGRYQAFNNTFSVE